MKKIGLIIELNAGELKPANLGMITAARGDDHELIALLLEPASDDVMEQLAQYGVHQIVRLNISSPKWNLEHWARASAKALPALQIDALLGLTTARGKDLLPRIAAILDAPLVMDCIQVDIARQEVLTSQYSGKIMATLRLVGETPIIGIRPNAVAPKPLPVESECKDFTVEIEDDTGLEVERILAPKEEGPDLTEADLIIAGGRGLKNGENFKLLRDCAREMDNTAVGASRVAVDLGWAPYEMQVGQTGARVNPKVYLACGISGSIQHFAGMKTAGMIIAINTDAEAAIVSNCDYYVQADLFAILPELANQLKAAASE